MDFLNQNLFGKAKRLLRSADKDEGRKILNSLLEAFPNNTDVRLEYGISLLHLNDFGRAIEEFTKLILGNGNDVRALSYRAEARIRSGDKMGGIEDLTRVIAIDPKHHFAYLSRGRVKIEIGDIIGSITDFDRHMQLGEKDQLSGLLNRGRAFYLLRSYSKAIQDFTEAMNLEGRIPIYSPYFRGLSRMASGDYAGAISDFSLALNSFSGLSNAYRARSEAKLSIGDRKGAQEDLEMYYQLGGRDLDAYKISN